MRRTYNVWQNPPMRTKLGPYMTTEIREAPPKGVTHKDIYKVELIDDGIVGNPMNSINEFDKNHMRISWYPHVENSTIVKKEDLTWLIKDLVILPTKLSVEDASAGELFSAGGKRAKAAVIVVIKNIMQRCTWTTLTRTQKVLTVVGLPSTPLGVWYALSESFRNAVYYALTVIT